MKAIFISILLIGNLVGYAQHGHHHKGLKDMSPEQVATLETKKLTLALELTEKQQAEIFQLEVANAEFRKAKHEEIKSIRKAGNDEKPSTDEKYEFLNERLDRQIAHKENMKGILNKDQFEKWEKMLVAREMRGKCRVHKGRQSR